MELVYERGSSELSTCSIATELEKVDESEMDENDPLQVAKGEDCPDYPESVGLQAIYTWPSDQLQKSSEASGKHENLKTDGMFRKL